jgi:hypothetical protein
MRHAMLRMTISVGQPVGADVSSILGGNGEDLLIDVHDEDSLQAGGSVALAFSLAPRRSPGNSEKFLPA